jgi:hypothetical protein
MQIYNFVLKLSNGKLNKVKRNPQGIFASLASVKNIYNFEQGRSNNE